MPKINLKYPSHRMRGRQVADWSHVVWKKSLPFFVNTRGFLTHRVSWVYSIIYKGELSHTAVGYLCGNSGIEGTGHGLFYEDPPADRLLCELCENIAIRRRLPTADQLAGRHIHVGRIRVEQTCCIEKKESN
jgi:hypothetical protein